MGALAFPRMRAAWAAPLFLALWLAGAPAAAAGARLELWSLEPRRLLWGLEVEAGQVFHLEHQNSIYLAPVRETYRVEPGGRLRQIGLRSPSAGVFEYYGFDAPPGGRLELSLPVGHLRLRSMSYEHHRLLIRDKTVALVRLARPGQALLLKLVAPQPRSGEPKR